jgi:hypothetical protein
MEQNSLYRGGHSGGRTNCDCDGGERKGRHSRTLAQQPESLPEVLDKNHPIDLAY